MSKWGNSAGAIIPAKALAKAGIKLGDRVELIAEAGQIMIKSPAPSYTLDELLACYLNNLTLVIWLISRKCLSEE